MTEISAVCGSTPKTGYVVHYEKPTNWTLIGDGTGHRRQMNWMRVPEALDSAASTHFSDLAAFVFRMELGKG
ncbi:hypothetical protein [Xanthomonas phaseoli]|uniref:hypothetical protein n=1 Tax=Xanthomonas phaseoli TaxID=1985254 RepID=UPI00135F1AA5|nr:hypothetical protein [Xanthomonas phaseoli]